MSTTSTIAASGVVAIRGADGRTLLEILPDGSVIGEIEDATEAAAIFVREVRRLVRFTTLPT